MNLPLQAFNDDHEQFAVIGTDAPTPDMPMAIRAIVDHERERQNESLAEFEGQS